jgi:CHAT domain-containing protein/tetratricopeptide (TPR) repeat protein
MRSRLLPLALLLAVVWPLPVPGQPIPAEAPQSEVPPVLLLGSLSRQDPFDAVRKQSRRKLHELPLQAGKTYAIDLKSDDFTPFLRVEDNQGKELASNHDSDRHYDAWLLFVPPRTGTFRLIVTTEDAGKVGSYWLTVQRYAAASPAKQRHDLESQAMALNRQGLAAQRRGEYTKGLAVVEQAVALWRKLYTRQDYPRGHPELATGVSNMGFLYKSQWKYNLALDHYREALAMRRQLYPEGDFPIGHEDLAESLHNLSLLYQSQGDYDQAMDSMQQAFAMRRLLYPEQDYPQGHAKLAVSLNSLGGLHLLRGEYTRAAAYLQQALEMRRRGYPEQFFPRGHPSLALCVNNLGLLAVNRGEYSLAAVYYQQFSAMCRKLYPENEYPHGHPYLAQSLNNLGFTYWARGEYASALASYQQALAMFRRLYPEKDYPNGHPELANDLMSLGLLHSSIGDHAQAQECYDQVRTMLAKLYPQNRYPRGHQLLADLWNNLGALHEARGDNASALKYHAQSLASRRQLFPKETFPDGHPLVARSLVNLGAMYNNQGDYPLALDFDQQARAMLKMLYPTKVYPKGHPELARCLHNLGLAYLCRAEPQRARDHLGRALEMQQQLTEAYVDTASEAEALNFVANLPPTRDALLSASPEEPELPGLYRHVWANRSLLFRLMERRHLDLRAASNSETQTLARDLEATRDRLIHLLFRPLKDRAKNATEVSRLTEGKESLERKIAVTLRLRTPAAALAGTPAQLQDALPADAAFLDLVRYVRVDQDPLVPGKKGRKLTPSYVAFVLSRGAMERVELGPAAPIDKAVSAWREAITNTTPGGGLASAAGAVRRLVWEQLAGHLPRTARALYIAPDGSLSRLPWAALPGSRKDTVLLEDYTFAMVPHGHPLLRQLAQEERPIRTGPLLLVGNVNYDAAAVAAVQGSLTDTVLRSAALPDKRLAWSALPGTGVEIEQIAKLAQGRVATLVLKGAQANAAEVEKKLAQARYAHLATHGFFAGKELRSSFQLDETLFTKVESEAGPARRFTAGSRSPLVLSGLVFAGANQPEAADRGILVADSLVGLDLSGLDLAVLSACETGLGEVAGGEGVFGLQRAFHIAGCKNVVASLWKVPDRPTAALMALFYRNLWEKRLPPVESLRQAQLEIYRNPKRIAELTAEVRGTFAEVPGSSANVPESGLSGQAHPRLWAAFTVSGAGR